MDSPETPKWLTKLLQDIADCFECVPPKVAWSTWLPNKDDGWHAEIYPGPIEHEGEKGYPTASVELGEVLGMFSSFDDGVGAGIQPPDVNWNDEGVTIYGGIEGGHIVTVTVMLQAPDDVPAMTRILPGEGLSWVDIDADEPPPPEARKRTSRSN
jgi:hypothetical protein